MHAVEGSTVLVLNASYEPLHRVSLKHAIKMLVREVAVIEEALELTIGQFIVPKVLRLVRYVNAAWRWRENRICSKKGVLARDRNQCGYCGGHAQTVDHILPRSRGGPLSWTNAVAACFRCNNRKADRTPEEAGMPLMVEPTVPVKEVCRDG